MRRLAPVLLAALALTSAAPAQVTYSKDIAPVFQAKCQQCHRDGGVSPFALNDYAAAVTWRRDIQNSILTGSMPPWKPVPGYGDFRDSHALTDRERQMILDWLDADMPEGDPADLPAPLPDQGDWPLGQPDLVVQMAQGFTPPVGADVYRCFVVPLGLTQDTDMAAIDVLPGNRQIVHHVILYQDTAGQAQMLDGADGQPGYTCFGGPGFDLTINGVLAGWAPGQRPAFLPDGIGIRIQKNATMVMQVHYSPSRTTGEDVTRMAFYKSTKPVQHHLYTIPVFNDTFTIPAGASNYTVSPVISPRQVNGPGYFTVPALLDAHVVSIYPHMHLLGRQIKVDLVLPDKTVTPMIYEDNWDFRWQGYYTYTTAVPAKANSTLQMTCTYDNSDNNPNNPNNPLVDVSWGERTRDEMCVALVAVTFDNFNILPFSLERTMPVMKSRRIPAPAAKQAAPAAGKLTAQTGFTKPR